MDYSLFGKFLDMCTSIKRGNYRGTFSNAKPIFLLSLTEYIPFMTENKIGFVPKLLVDFYKTNFEHWEQNTNTAIIHPFFHLGTEPFYQIVWKPGIIVPNFNSTPSAAFLRENLEYAKLDDALWEILQDSANREYLRQAIIAKYLKK